MALIRELYIDSSLWLPMSPISADNIHPHLVNSNLFCGVELELENCKAKLPSHGGTTQVGDDLTLQHSIVAHQDGSLRNGGIELVTKPVRGKQLVEQVEYICRTANTANWKPSNRAGLHIHVNTQDLIPDQWINLLKAYVLVEPCFFTAIGQERKGSIYCKSWYQYAPVDELKQQLKRVKSGEGVGLNSRYLGLNINSTSKYGTLEFRHKNSTTDANDILFWINTIMRWYRYGTNHTITEEMVRSMTPELAVNSVFGDSNLMDAEFASHFYHGCIPLWFDLFSERKIKSRSWSREKARIGHKGYTSYVSKRKPSAPTVAAADQMSDPMIEENHSHADFDYLPGVPFFHQRITPLQPKSRVYYTVPGPRPLPMGFVPPASGMRGEFFWVTVPGRPDLMCRSSRHEEVIRGAGTIVYSYATNFI